MASKNKNNGNAEPQLSSEEIDALKSGLVMDLLMQGHFPPDGAPILGEALLGIPENQDIVMDFTTNMGMCSNVYWSFIFQLPKWGYNTKKVDEWMDVSPVHADSYNLMVAQRQKIEAAIKTGLSSAAESVTHYELLAHDSRRYREILDYFKQGQKDEHVLRSLFVDRVDAFTGEGYSMITMVKRWPTIITDFIRMDSGLGDINDIRKELDVSQAEATVLKTKNELYIEWKKLFLPVLKERYARIETMVKSRKKSIDEYKKWLKPYITRHKMMQEMPERSPAAFATDAVMVPGFGQAVMFSGVRLWIWRPFNPEEEGKREFVGEVKGGVPVDLDPYDDFVKKWIPHINHKYGVKLNDKKVRSLLRGWTQSTTEKPRKDLDLSRPYYIFFDVNVSRSVIKTPPPEGGELENIMLNPLRTVVISQNVLLLYLLEIWAIEQKFDREVNELIGAPDLEEAIREEIEKEFEPEKKTKERLKSTRSFFSRMGSAGRGVKTAFSPLKKYFIRPGPYESDFKERVTKVYMVGSGGIYQQMVDFWKSKMGVG
jgi:hypothetical protein